MKNYKLSKNEIRPLVEGYGACFATIKITVEGYPIRFMYREEPDNDIDSGWRFMSGFESDEYMNDPDNIEIYDVNTIANYDQTIIPLLDEPVGSAFEKSSVSERFVAVSDWSAGDEI